MTKWALKLIDLPAKILGVASPSTVTRDWAYWMAEGFVNQMNYQAPRVQESITNAFAPSVDQQALIDAGTNSAFAIADSFIQQMNYQAPYIGEVLRAPFEDFINNWLPGVPQFYLDTAAQSAQALIDGYATSDIGGTLRAPFEDFLNNWLPGVPQFYSDTAAQAAAALTDGYATSDVGGMLRAPFEDFLYNWLPGVPQFYSDTAAQAAAALVSGYETSDIGGTLRAPFEYFLNEWLPGVPQFYTDTATASIAAWITGYTEPEDLSIVLRRPFEYHLNTWMPGFAPEMLALGRAANSSFVRGYKSPRDLSIELRAPFEHFLNVWARGIGPQMNNLGRTAGTEFTTGWCATLNLVTCFDNAMRALQGRATQWGQAVGSRFSAGAAQGAQSTGGSQPPSGGGGTRTPGAYRTVFQPPGEGNTCRSGFTLMWNPVNRTWVCVRQEDINGNPIIPPNINSTGPNSRQSGGPIQPGQLYRLHEDELILTPRKTGTVLPSSVLRGIEKMAELGKDSPSTSVNAINTTNAGPVIVTLNQNIHAASGMDTEGLAQLVTNQAVAAIIDVLDDAERRAPNPLSRILPGGIR
jgi:hypothetical protein